MAEVGDSGDTEYREKLLPVCRPALTVTADEFETQNAVYAVAGY